MLRTILAAVLAASLAGALAPQSAIAQGHAHDSPQPVKTKWSFAGPLGHYDRGQLQRGFKVYREVCQVCHGLKMIAFRNLSALG